MARLGEQLRWVFRLRPPRSPGDRRPPSTRAWHSAGSAGFGGERASPRAAETSFPRLGARDDRGSRQSKAVSSVRSLTDPLFEDRGGVILIEFDQLLQLALGTVVASREQRLHEFVLIGTGLDEDALAGLTVAAWRPQCGRLASGRAAPVRQRDCARRSERHPHGGAHP